MTTMSEAHGTQDHGQALGHEAHPGHTPAFSDAEMAEFQKSDIGAGGAVVVLMAAIFGIGLLLYTSIAIIVAM
jgi:hypothetical protein